MARFGPPRRSHWFSWVSGCLSVSALMLAAAPLACGGQPAAPAAPLAVTVAPPAASAAPTPANSTEPDAPPPARDPGFDATEGRLRLMAHGVRLTLRAVLAPEGESWGASVEVDAASADGAAHSIAASHASGLHFGGSWSRTELGPDGLSVGLGGFGEGGSLTERARLEPGESTHLQRRFPGDLNVEPVRPGYTLRLGVSTYPVESPPVDLVPEASLVGGDYSPRGELITHGNGLWSQCER